MDFEDFKQILKIYEGAVDASFKEEHDILQYLRRKALADENEKEYAQLVRQIKDKKDTIAD